MTEPSRARGSRRPLRLTVIGSAAAWSLRSGRPSSCYLVELGDDAIVLDLGQGSLGALAERRPLRSIGAVLISHLHPDHHVDVVPLRHYAKFGMGGSAAPTLHAPPGLRARYDAFLGEDGFLRGLPGDDVSEGSWTIGPFHVEARPVTHAPNAFAFRVSPAESPDLPGLVYSGDCGRWQDLLPLIRPGDSLLCEAFWGTGSADVKRMHLSAADAAQAALHGRARQLILTHLAPDQDPQAIGAQAERVFGGPLALAEPGLRLQIG